MLFREKGYFNVLATFSVEFRLLSGKLCKNNDHTWFFIALTLVGYLGRYLNTRSGGLMFKQLSRDPAKLMHEKTCVIPIFPAVRVVFLQPYWTNSVSSIKLADIYTVIISRN